MSSIPRTPARRMLIVEHERDVANSLARFFAAQGYSVCNAHTAGDAVAICNVFAPDVALVDVSTEHGAGFELARYIRQKRQDAVLIVATTSKGFVADRARSHDAGVDHYFVKSSDPHLLLGFVAHRPPAPPRPSRR